MQGRIYAVCWTWRRHQIVPTKKAGRELMLELKAKFEADGYVSRSSGVGGYLLDHPEGNEAAIAFHEYDAETKRRIIPEPKARKPRPERSEPKPRRGRKPIHV